MAKEFDLFLKNRNIYIYGIGECSFFISLYCILKKIPIKGFIVSNKKKNINNFLGFSVCSVKDLSKPVLNDAYIIATSEKYHEDILQSLKEVFGDLEKIQYLCVRKYLYEEILRELVKDVSWINFFSLKDIKEKFLSLWFMENVRNIFEFYHFYLKPGRWNEYLDLKRKEREIPRYQSCKVMVDNKQWLVPDILSFIGQYKEILIDEIYSFSPQYKDIYILDIGANVGTSVKFFRDTYPNAVIEAYEADPYIFSFLQHNVKETEKDTKTLLYQCAIWDENIDIEFYSEGADGGRINTKKNVGKNNIRVKAIDVLKIMEKYPRIDFLKIDIEGSETKVLKRIANKLDKVENIFLEYHSIVNEQQTLDEIIFVLRENGFRVSFEGAPKSSHPFKRWDSQNGFDVQMNIYAVKKE